MSAQSSSPDVTEPSVVHTTLFVRIHNTIERIPDQAWRGVYRVDLNQNTIPKEEAAFIALTSVAEMIQLAQPHLSTVQVYDYNGHEISWPVPPLSPEQFQCTITRVETHPVVVDATRTTEDLFKGT